MKNIEFDFYRRNHNVCKNIIKPKIEEEISKVHSDWLIDSLSIDYPNNLFDWSLVKERGISYRFTYRIGHLTIPKPSLGNFHLRHRDSFGPLEKKLSDDTLPNLIYETHTVTRRWKFGLTLSEAVSEMRNDKLNQLFS